MNPSEKRWKKEKSKTKLNSLRTKLKEQAPETSEFLPTSSS